VNLQISPRNKSNPPKDDKDKQERQQQFNTLKQKISSLEDALKPYQISSELGPVAARVLHQFFNSDSGHSRNLEVTLKNKSKTWEGKSLDLFLKTQIISYQVKEEARNTVKLNHLISRYLMRKLTSN